MYPVRADLPWDDIDGHVLVALPRRRSGVEKWIARFFPVPENVLLTFERGSASFWRLADGTRDMDAITSALADEPGAAPRMPERVRLFAERLTKRGLIEMKGAPSPAADTRRGLTPERGFHVHACKGCGFRAPIRAPPRARFLCPRCKRPQRLPQGNTNP